MYARKGSIVALTMLFIGGCKRLEEGAREHHVADAP
jgi:hypothetical protein